jgi:hypothetical protein
MRWRVKRVDGSGSVRQVLRQASLGPVSRREAERRLREKLAEAEAEVECDATFAEVVAIWDRTVLPMYKHSMQRGPRQILRKHLLPTFGSGAAAAAEAPGCPGFSHRHVSGGTCSAFRSPLPCKRASETAEF